MPVHRKAAIGFIFITLLLDTTGIGIIIPVVPKLIVELIHGDMSDASRFGGWLMFTYSVMQFLFSPVMGNLSDRFGRRPVLLLSLFGLGVDFLAGFQADSRNLKIVAVDGEIKRLRHDRRNRTG